MLDSPLLQTLRLLGQEEIDNLHYFVGFPFLQDKFHARDTLRFFEEIKKFQPDFQDDSLRREVIAQTLFQGRTNPARDVDRAMADLFRITRHFINFRYSAVKSSGPRKKKSDVDNPLDIEKLLNDTRQDLAMMRFYNERLHNRPTPPVSSSRSKPVAGKKIRDPNKYFENLYAGLVNDLEQVKDFSAFEEQEFNEYLFFRYQVQQEKFLFDGLKNPGNNDQNLIATMDELDTFYLFNKLHFLSSFINLEQYLDLSEAYPDDYQRILENKKFMLLICKLINKTDLT